MSLKKLANQLSTERLRLRTMIFKDAEDLFTLRSDPKVNHYIARVAPRSIEDVHEWMGKVMTGVQDGNFYYWTLRTKDKDQMIGTICLWNFSKDKRKAEVGYELLPQYQGQGFMNEALSAVLEFSKDILGLKTIEAFTQGENAPSKKLLEKFKFEHDPQRTDPDFPLNQIFILNL